MKTKVKKAAGVAVGNTRLDGVKLTDSIVNDVLGGSRAAERQANAYSNVIAGIKNGKGTRGTAGSMAEAARNRMLERDAQRNRAEVKHPDIGKDKANRKAYPSKQ